MGSIRHKYMSWPAHGPTQVCYYTSVHTFCSCVYSSAASVKDWLDSAFCLVTFCFGLLLCSTAQHELSVFFMM